MFISEEKIKSSPELSIFVYVQFNLIPMKTFYTILPRYSVTYLLKIASGF